MFSKKIRVASWASMALVFMGCVGKIGEAPPPQTAQKFSDTQCLSAAKPVVKSFFQGTATNAQVTATWDCINTALESFKKRVRGETSDRFTAQEMATFLEANFLDMKPGETISVELQNDLMKIKQLLVGGSDQFITMNELTLTQRVVVELRDTSVSLNPYMKIITQKWTASQGGPFADGMKLFEEANSALQDTAKVLAKVIERNGKSYSLSDFVSCTNNLALFFTDSWDLNKPIEKYMPVVRKIKKAIAGGDEDRIEPQEWSRFALLGARGYVQYLRYFYFIDSKRQIGNGYRVAYMARTVEDIFSIFADLVGQKPEGLVTRQEVQDLMKTLSDVWPTFKSSPKLVLELMKVKRTLFGGSLENWNTADFTRARGKVDRLRLMVERFLPYASIYGLDWRPDDLKPKAAREFFFESQTALQLITQDASVLFEEGYDLADLNSLVAELHNLYQSELVSDLAATVRKYMPLIVDAKGVFLGDKSGSLITKDQWPKVLHFGGRIYADFLFNYYFLKDQTWDDPVTLQDLSFFMNQSLDILNDILKAKNTQLISNAEMLKILNHLAKLDILPKALKEKALANLVDLALNNILFPYELRLKGQKSNGLTQTSIAIAREEAQIWIDAEKFLMQIAQSSRRLSNSAVKIQDVLNRLDALSRDSSASKHLKTAAIELQVTLMSPVPMAVDAKSRLLISTDHIGTYDVLSLRKANFNRAVARIIIRSLANDSTRIRDYVGINLAELQVGFDKLLPLVIEMGLIDPSNTSFASSRFREANIFTPHGNGNDVASFAEISDISGMIFSGLKINTMLYDRMTKDCFGGRTNVASTESVKIDCVKKSYRNTMPAALSSMPDYVNYMTKIPADEWSNYMTNVFKTAGYVPNKDEKAKLRDISLTPHVIQYIEMIFARYDKDRNHVITTDEALEAFPAFRGILVELAADSLRDGSLKEEHLPSLFTYILKKGKPPESTLEKIRYAWFWRDQNPSEWDVNAGRSMLAHILGFIADRVATSTGLSMSGTPTEEEVKTKPLPKLPPPPAEEQVLFRN